jgi:hypothetical protein
MKIWQTRVRCQDEFVAVIDPRGNSGYQRVATAMNGLYVPFGIGSDKHINPWDIKGYLNLELLRALAATTSRAWIRSASPGHAARPARRLRREGQLFAAPALDHEPGRGRRRDARLRGGG